MNDNLVAHSSPKDDPEREPHGYADHVLEVERIGLAHGHAMFHYAALSKDIIAAYLKSLRNALCIHDIGKLEPGNQDVLRGDKAGRLPYDHVDGGVAVALKVEDTLAAWLIRAHHAPGLASCKDEKKLKWQRNIGLLRGGRRKRGDCSKENIKQHKNLIAKTETVVDHLISAHETSSDHKLEAHTTPRPGNDEALATRLLLSCLVDADHSDTAAYYSADKENKIHCIQPRWQERLEKLTTIVGNMAGEDHERKVLRDKLFSQCLNINISDKMTTCAAPVGLGKTTAVVANLLQRAIDHKLRRIIVVAPFTNVISQTAKRLRCYLALEGEDPYEVIAEHHHRAEFSKAELRKYSQNWQAPIIVTTAVQFFETLASASPSTLRKLHRLPGSAIFIDEAHACVPLKLMRQTWFWIKQLADNWSCHFVLASGSLVKFWEETDIVGEEYSARLPSILSGDFFQETQIAERERINFERLEDGKAISKEELLNAICSEEIKGSRLIILNTVQSAVVIAQALQRRLQAEIRDDYPLSKRIVLHISTALAPVDRERIIDELAKRQYKDSPWKDKNWYLVATSCVEAGVDLDFDNGFRERCSLTSFLQTAGRVNREGLNHESMLYDFSLICDKEILAHPAFKDSIDIFDIYWENLIAKDQSLDELSTLALTKEVQRAANDSQAIELKNEKKCNFQHVQKQFKIISSDTLTVIVNDKVSSDLEKNIPVSYRDIQNHSIQIWRNKIEEFGLTSIDQNGGLYQWNHGYDPNFLGYMRDLDSMIRVSGWIN